MLLEARDLACLWDMVDAAQAVVDMTSGVHLSTYLKERMRQLAVERAVEIIGEAAKQVGEGVKEGNPGIPWRLIIAQRNVLAHDYGAIDPERMWRLAVQDIPSLLLQLRPLLEKAEGGV
ncbi:MAG: DUF86 domain-containing protein [Rhodospirillales bacterium]|nr:DUF86 domain-containing protein [Rhodospirillales bacterium]